MHKIFILFFFLLLPVSIYSAENCSENTNRILKQLGFGSFNKPNPAVSKKGFVRDGKPGTLFEVNTPRIDLMKRDEASFVEGPSKPGVFLSEKDQNGNSILIASLPGLVAMGESISVNLDSSCRMKSAVYVKSSNGKHGVPTSVSLDLNNCTKISEIFNKDPLNNISSDTDCNAYKKMTDKKNGLNEQDFLGSSSPVIARELCSTLPRLINDWSPEVLVTGKETFKPGNPNNGGVETKKPYSLPSLEDLGKGVGESLK